MQTRLIRGAPGTLLLGFLLHACGGETSTSEGDTDGQQEPIIQDGEEDIAGFYTFVVQVGQGCSGTLVTNRHVLTAGHCVCPEVQVNNTPGVDKRRSAANCLDKTQITLTGNNIQDTTISGSVTAHPQFLMDLGETDMGETYVVGSTADIALVELDSQAPLSYGFVPASDQNPLIGTPVTIAGYGRESCSENASFGTRRYGTNQVDSLPQDLIRIEESTGHIAWKGDSGGPMFATLGNTLRVAGVASTSRCNDNSESDSSSYTNVALYYNWIAAAIAGSQGGTCGDFTCDVGETAATCCTDCGCPGGMACQQNTCNPDAQCAPNSTCCDGAGTATPLGANGPGCEQECNQCNGAGTCTPRANGVTCASGQGACDGIGGCSVSTCGDGANSIDVGEECDGANLGGASCATEGFSGGNLSCSPNCTLDTSNCTLQMCGNGNIDIGEQCDGGNLSGATCASQGFEGGTLSCSQNCALDTSGCTKASCGDGKLDQGEQCDGNNLGGASCKNLGLGDGDLSCTENCNYNTEPCTILSIESQPGLGSWTPNFTPNIEGPCEPGNEDYHTLYRGKIASISVNESTSTLQFKKHDGSALSTDVTYWVVVGDAEPSCLDIMKYVVRKSGTWQSQNTTLTVDEVPIWPSADAFNQAPCGETKYLFVITGGGGGYENSKVWFQKEPLAFTKKCG